MAVAPQTGMDKSEYKTLLMKSKKEPVNFCFGQGSDQSSALLVLSRNKEGKSVERELTTKFSDARNTRYGIALVDVDENAKLVKFFVNKPVSSMAKRLAKTLKGTGFSKVEILLEDGSPVESFAEDEEAPTPAGTTPPPPPSSAEPADSAPTTAAPADTSEEATTAPPPPPPPPPLQAEQPKPDAGELARKLAELIKRIPTVVAVAPGLADQLKKLATDANVNLKTNNLTYAAAYIESLRRTLDSAPPPPSPSGAATPDAAALTKALAALIPRIGPVVTANPGAKDALTKLATDANVNLKTNNLAAAAADIQSLREALDKAAAPSAPSGSNGATGDLAKYSADWLAARTRLADELEKLANALNETYQADGSASEIVKRYRDRVAPILTNLNEDLAGSLGKAAATTDAGARQDLLAQAKSLIDGYSDYLGKEPLIADLESNPFVPLAITQTVTDALATVRQVVG